MEERTIYKHPSANGHMKLSVMTSRSMRLNGTRSWYDIYVGTGSWIFGDTIGLYIYVCRYVSPNGCNASGDRREDLNDHHTRHDVSRVEYYKLRLVPTSLIKRAFLTLGSCALLTITADVSWTGLEYIYYLLIYNMSSCFTALFAFTLNSLT